MCSFCVRLCGWTRSLCLSALPSDRAPDEVIRTVTGVARLHCLYLAGVSVVRCQIVITLVVSLLSVSVFQVLRLFSPDRVSVFPWRVRTGLYSLPELETLHCRVYCTCTADDICTFTVFWSQHLHCQLIFTSTVCWSCQIKTSVSTRNWISSFLYRDNYIMDRYFSIDITFCSRKTFKLQYFF